MLRFRGFKRHTICQTYERFYFPLVCFRFILLPKEQLRILSTTTLVGVGVVYITNYKF